MRSYDGWGLVNCIFEFLVLEKGKRTCVWRYCIRKNKRFISKFYYLVLPTPPLYLFPLKQNIRNSGFVLTYYMWSYTFNCHKIRLLRVGNPRQSYPCGRLALRLGRPRVRLDFIYCFWRGVIR